MFKHLHRVLMCGSVLALGHAIDFCWTSSAWSQTPPPSVIAPPKSGSQKTVQFEMRQQPWDKVLEWLADTTGLHVIPSYKPQGSFDFISSAKKTQYTIPEVIDILNEALAAQKVPLMLVRKATSIVVIAVDEVENIDSTTIPILSIEDLDIDKPSSEQRFGKSELAQVIFTLKNLTKEEAERDMKPMLGKFHRIAAIGKGNKIRVMDKVENLRRAKKLLDEIDGGTLDAVLEIIPLGAADGETARRLAMANWGWSDNQPKPINAPQIDFDKLQNRLIVRGDKDQIAEVKRIVRKLGGAGGVSDTENASERLRVITLDRGTPSTVIDNLAYLWSELRANPMLVLTQSQLMQQLESLKSGKTPTNTLKPIEIPKSNQNHDQSSTQSNSILLVQDTTTGQPPSQLSDPRSQLNQRQLPGRADKPVLVAPLARGNGIMFASDDPDALTLVDELIRYLTQSDVGDYEVITIRNANASDVAKVLDEIYNGKKQTGMAGFPGMMMMGGGGRGGGVLPESASTVRIVADVRTNAILVRAPKLELATIRRLLKETLDTPGVDANALNRRHIIGPLANANAAEVVNIIKEIYKDYLASSGGGSPGPQNPFFPFGGGGRGNGGGNAERSQSFTITVAADERTNCVVVNAPENIYKQIEALVHDLDGTSTENRRSVKVVPIENLDPVMVQQAVDAITGQRREQASTNNNQRSGPMSPEEMRQRFLDRLRGGGGGGPGNFGGGGGPGNFGGGGGFNRGGGGGGNNRGGGNNNRQGGGGRRGGGQSSLETESPPGGPHFFADRVKEDPRSLGVSQLLYDPQQDSNAETVIKTVSAQSQSPSTSAQQPTTQTQPQTPQPGTGGQGTQPPATKQPVTTQILDGLGSMVIIGEPEDIEAIIRVIESLKLISQQSETEIRIFPLKKGDATSISNTLNTVYQRLVVGASAITRAPQTQQNQQASILILPLPRFNAILIGAPKSRMKDIEDNINKLDISLGKEGRVVFYPLKRGSSDRIATIITQLYSQRYPGEVAGQNQIVVQSDSKTNTLIIQASPADQEEIARLVEYLEHTVSNVINELRIIPLKNATATELSTILQQALREAAGTPSQPSSTTPTQQGPGAQGQLPGQGGQFGQFGQFGQQGRLPGQTTGTGTSTAQAGDNKGMSLRFVSPTLGGRAFESGLLDEIFVYPDTRTNALIILAPPQSIELINAIVKELDVPPTAQAEIKVFQLKRADATGMLQILQQIYYGNARTGTTGGAFGNQPFGGGFGNFGQTGGMTGQRMPFAFQTAEGPSQVELRFGLDQRTNTLIVAGSRGDLVLVEAIINRLDSAELRERKDDVYRVRNSDANSLATTLSNYLRSVSQVMSIGDQTPFPQMEREVVIVPEPITNSLIISATSRYYADVMRLIERLDYEPPQVVIQVLIAEVTLDNREEFGMEWGVQTPLLFQRSVIPATTSNFTNPFTPQGVSVTSNVAVGNPGFNFNTTNPLGNVVVSPSALGAQGITNLGVGRASADAGVGGFVFSAGSDAVNVLIRALKIQGKIEILSRPQISVMDNQTASFQAGQDVPYVNGFNVNLNNQLTPIVSYRSIGIVLSVQPRVTPDGHVVMRVDPSISSLSTSTVNLGNNTFSPIFNVTQASTTISALDGQTVVIGGLIASIDNRNERKLPYLGDLPWVGAAFRFRTHSIQKRELLILLTPRVVRNREEAERVKNEEACKMDWALHQVERMHGPIGLEPTLDPMPNGQMTVPETKPAPPVGTETLPNAPQKVVPNVGPKPTGSTQFVPPTNGNKPDANQTSYANGAPSNQSAPVLPSAFSPPVITTNGSNYVPLFKEPRP